MNVESPLDPRKPRLSDRKKLPSTPIDSLYDDMVVVDALWQRATVIGQIAEDVKWLNSVIDHVDFTESRVIRLSMRAAEFDHCLAANTDWSEALLDDVLFRDCKLTGMKLNEARFNTVHLVNCKADFAQFQGIKAKHLVFDHCDLSNAYFSNADLKAAVFHDCDLTRVEFSQAILLGADLRGSTIEGIRIDPTKLPKVKVNIAQAIYIAQLLGLDIE